MDYLCGNIINDSALPLPGYLFPWCCQQGSLDVNGFFCRELKLEIAALRSSTLHGNAEVEEMKSLFIRLLESLVGWQSGTESALESADIDMQKSREC